MECLTLRELQTIAYESAGREIWDADTYKDVDDWANRLWGNEEAMDQERVENEERRLKKHTSLREEWESKFENLDMQRAKSRNRKQEDVEMSC
jgi:DNA ligase-4